MLYTHHHNDINHNSTYTYAKTQADYVVQVRTVLLTSDFSSSTRGKRQFLKSLSYHTLRTTPQRSAHLVMF